MGKWHPCANCDYGWYAYIGGTRACCQYILVTGHTRPNAVDEPCTVRRVHGQSRPTRKSLTFYEPDLAPGPSGRAKKVGKKRRPIPAPTKDAIATVQTPKWISAETDGGSQKSHRAVINEPLALTMHRALFNDTEIAEAVGVSPGTIRTWRERHGLPSNYRKKKEGTSQ